MAGFGSRPDPLRDHFVRGARQLLDRAYAHPGTWAGTRLADPSERGIAWCRSYGIDPFGPDNVSAAGGRRGGLNARTRWMRAFVRCLYDQHRWWSEQGGGWRDEKRTVPRDAGALRVDVGAALPARGIIPAGRAVRVQLGRGGQVSWRAARRLPDRDRIYDDSGRTAARWSDPARRDW